MVRPYRVFMSAAFAFGLTLIALQSGGPTAAQDKAKDKAKEKPKAKPRIAVNDPEKLKDDADFAIQGEYEGEIVLNVGPKKVGVQVVARGEGTFVLKMMSGGLPGAGWEGKDFQTLDAKRGDDGVVAITGKNHSGTIANGKIQLKDGMKVDATLTKVNRSSPTIGAKPPEGAKVLFGQPGDETQWTSGKVVELSDGKFLGNGITTKDAFGSFKAHIEFRLPWMPNSTGQQRGNSGFYLQNRYELQILDSFGLKGENNECGGIYTVHKPLVNMCLPPMVWQTYDIEFTAAAFDGDKKTANAKVTVVHNGVKIHDGAEIPKSTGGGKDEGPKPGPIQLQNHGDPLVFRNVWVLETK